MGHWCHERDIKGTDFCGLELQGKALQVTFDERQARR